MKNTVTDAFITTKPASKNISRYISYYYFHSSDNENYKKNFVFYPNYKHALTAYKDSEVTITETESIINASNGNHIKSLYSINKDKNVRVTIKGCFDKIGIVFNPLGINHFIKKPLQELFNADFDFFPHLGNDFTEVLYNVFSESKTDKKVALLDLFFENKLNDFDQPFLKKAVKELLISNGAVKVGELSEQLDINRKSLLRLFSKHTNMSVEEYRKMVMFRRAFNYFQQHKETINLTDAALFSMYYDQAHFIKHFKSITKETPNSLLSKISHLGEEDTYWYFEE